MAPRHFAPRLHAATEGLCRWLCHHLATPELIAWVIGRGCHLHAELIDSIRRRLPDASLGMLPRGPERLWRFWSAPVSAVYDGAIEHQALGGIKALQTADWSPVLRDSVLSWLAPRVRFEPPFRFEAERDIDPNDVHSYSEIDLVPAAGPACESLVATLLARTDVGQILPDMLGEFTGLLHRGLTYLEYLGFVSADYDHSYSVRPSIDDHEQNTDTKDWVIYIHGLRKIWQSVAATDSTRARDEVARWIRLPYPIFRRFVLWTAGKPGGLTADETALFICQRPPTTLWGLETRRELLHCLRKVAGQFSPTVSQQLAAEVLKGPPREQFRADISTEEFSEIRDRSIHLRLAEIECGGGHLDVQSRQVWADIRARHPLWTPEPNEREEFGMWVGGDFAWPEEVLPPNDWYSSKTDRELAAEFTQTPGGPALARVWRGLVRGDANRAVAVLWLLAELGFFDAGFWSLAAESLGGDDNLGETIKLYATVLPQLGHDFLESHLTHLAGLINRYFRLAHQDAEDAAWRLWDLLVEPAAVCPQPEDRNPAVAALGSAIGNLTEGLIIKIGELQPQNYQQIPFALQTRLESLLTGASSGHLIARVVLARALAWLHRLKVGLVEPDFLVRFDWSASEEARYLWIGYLMRPRVTPGLWPALRPLLLKVFSHSPDLGDYEEQFYAFFASLLLHADYELEPRQARHALTVGTAKGRSHVAWYWWRQSDSATDYGAKLYRERLKYLLERVWPLERELRDERSSTHLVRLATCCSSEFPDAVAAILPLICPVRDPHDIVWSLKHKDVVERFPEATLGLLSGAVGEDIQPWSAPYFREVLSRILTAPELGNDPRFRRLDALVRRFE